MSIGKNIQYYRKLNGISQKELAAKLGCATGTIQQYELGKREPKFDVIYNIAKILSIKPYSLYGIEEPDLTEERFAKACEWLEEAGFAISKPSENDPFQKYSIDDSEHGTICQMDKLDFIDVIESCIEDANQIRDEIAIRYIKKEFLK